MIDRIFEISLSVFSFLVLGVGLVVVLAFWAVLLSLVVSFTVDIYRDFRNGEDSD